MAANPFDKGNTAVKTRPAKNEPLAGDEDDIDESDSAPVGIGPKRDPFAMPSGGGGDYKFTEFVGELLLVKPTEVDHVDTQIAADTECVRADVVRLDNENEQVEDLLVFPKALIRTLKKVLRGPNEWVLGRLERGTAKQGKSAPYILSKPTDDEIATASAVMKQLSLL